MSVRRIGKKLAAIYWAHKSPDDPEKAVLPALVFVNANHPKYFDVTGGNFKGCIFVLGWWHWSIAFGLVSPTTNRDKE